MNCRGVFGLAKFSELGNSVVFFRELQLRSWSSPPLNSENFVVLKRCRGGSTLFSSMKGRQQMIRACCGSVDGVDVRSTRFKLAADPHCGSAAGSGASDYAREFGFTEARSEDWPRSWCCVRSWVYSQARTKANGLDSWPGSSTARPRIAGSSRRL